MVRQTNYYEEPEYYVGEDELQCDECKLIDERPAISYYGERTLCKHCHAKMVGELEDQLNNMEDNDLSGTSEYKIIEKQLNELL